MSWGSLSIEGEKGLAFDNDERIGRRNPLQTKSDSGSKVVGLRGDGGATEDGFDISESWLEVVVVGVVVMMDVVVEESEEDID